MPNRTSQTDRRDTRNRGPRKILRIPIDSQRLKKLRLRMGWKPIHLANKSGVSIQTICRLEQASEVTDTSTLVALAKTFNVPIGTLLGEKRLDLSQYSIQPEIEEALKPLLNQLFQTPDLPNVLGRLTEFLKTGSPEKLSSMDYNISTEEEILGRWTSLIVAYENAEWEKMFEHANTIIKLGTDLNRPYLESIGHAYAAKAHRNMGKDEDQEKAREELENIPVEINSAIVYRLNGKILAKRDELDEARDCFEKAEQLFKTQPSRNNYLYALEKTKTLRNLARCHTRIANPVDAEKTGRTLPENPTYHLDKAEKYLKETKKSLDELKNHCIRTWRIEEMLLQSARFHLAKVQGDYPKAIGHALKGLRLAKNAEANYGNAKMRMFLVHAYTELGEYENAFSLYSTLKANIFRFPAPLKKSYKDWVEPKREELDRWEKEACKKEPPKAFRPVVTVSDQTIRECAFV